MSDFLDEAAQGGTLLGRVWDAEAGGPAQRRGGKLLKGRAPPHR